MIIVCLCGYLLGVHFEANELPQLCVCIAHFDSVAITKPVPIHTLHVIILLQFTLSVACHSPGNPSALPELALPIQALGSVQVLL